MGPADMGFGGPTCLRVPGKIPNKKLGDPKGLRRILKDCQFYQLLSSQQLFLGTSYIGDRLIPEQPAQVAFT